MGTQELMDLPIRAVIQKMKAVAVVVVTTVAVVVEITTAAVVVRAT
jgi:hypothetical protein